MTNKLFIILLLLIFSMNLDAQKRKQTRKAQKKKATTTKVQKKKPAHNITGKWVEELSNENENETKNPNMYSFTEDMFFHKGEVNDGLILFNISGKYSIINDTIKIIYFDFTQNRKNEAKAKKMIFRILELNDKKLKVMVSDYDIEYPLTLTKEQLE